MERKQYLFEVELLDYERGRKLAKDTTLSLHEKIGFPNEYREGYKDFIVADILLKLPQLRKCHRKIVDLGCGCDELAWEILRLSAEKQHECWMLDAPEMLAILKEHLPDEWSYFSCVGKFPDECDAFIAEHRGSFDAVLVYSVLMYVCVHDSIFNFIDKVVELLAPGGRVLLGDIPNRSKRRRFFRSPTGIKTHRAFTGTEDVPQVDPWELEYGKLDDSIVFAILQRYRAGGYETYLLPQGENLPMANRREDILIERRA